MIKILQFTLANSYGGSTQYIMNLWRNINKEKFHFDFVSFSPYIKYEDEIAAAGSKIYYIKTYPEENEELFIAEFESVLQHGYDVIECHTAFWKGTLVEQLAKKNNIPKIIIHSHSVGLNSPQIVDFELAQNQHDLIKNGLTVEVATDFWACSKSAAEWLYGDNIPKEKIKIIYNTIDTNKNRFDKKLREKYRRKYLLERKFVIGFVGRFERVKNIFFLMEIFKEVLERTKNAILFLVGDGSLNEALHEYAYKLGIANKVIWAGFQSNVEGFLNMMDVVCLPSEYEGFPITMLEAQCCGAKCICTDKCSDEIEVTSDIIRIEIDKKERWIDVINSYARGYNRKGNELLLIQKGFDTVNMIRRIESLYME